MDFSRVKEIVIPEGSVKKIVAAGKVIWQKITQMVNLLPLATDLDLKTIYDGKGFKTGVRLSSSTTAAGGTESFAKMCTSGYIPAKPGDILRIKRTRPKLRTGSYVFGFKSSNPNRKMGYLSIHQGDGHWYDTNEVSGVPETQTFKNGVLAIELTEENCGTGFDLIRFSAGVIDKYTIVTINQEITIPSLEQYGFKNWVDFSTTSDGKTIYNECGVKIGYRVSSNGSEKSASGCSCTGFIPVKGGDVVRFYGWPFDGSFGSGDAINVYDENFTHLGQAATNGSYGIFISDCASYQIYIDYDSRIKDRNGVWSWVVPPASSGIKYIRVSGHDGNGAPGYVMIVTVNEPIPNPVSSTNYITISTDANGLPFNAGQGWKAGYRIRGSTGEEEALSGVECTGFIPIKYGQTLTLENVKATSTEHHSIAFYKSDYSFIAGSYLSDWMLRSSNSGVLDGTSVSRIVSGKVGASTLTEDSEVAFVRFSASEITNNSVVTIT